MSIINFIQNFKKKNRVLFTTPSHSQGAVVAPKTDKLIGKKIFTSDYSENEGFDNLSRPIGMIKNVQDAAANYYQAKATFFLTNGSTSGVIAAMKAVLSSNDKVLIARNCHKSVYNGLVLTGAYPIWLMPSYNRDWGIYNPITAIEVEQFFIKNPDIKMFIMTNPTYEGVMSDVAKISEVCKKYNVKLMVDEAHGALWQFYKMIGTPALLQGADIVVQSLNKTAGALNPSALLHIGLESHIEPNDVQNSLNLITTTSPSYPLLGNIEGTIEFLASEKGRKEISELVSNIFSLIRTLKSVPNIEVFADNNDITKILVRILNVSGFDLSQILFDKYNIEDELVNEKSVLLLTGIGTTKAKLKKLEKALIDIAVNNIKIIDENCFYKPFENVEPRVRYTPALVWNRPYKEVDLKYSVSRVCMEVVLDYPPGIPILLPGEVIKKEHIDFLSQKRSKIKVLT